MGIMWQHHKYLYNNEIQDKIPLCNYVDFIQSSDFSSPFKWIIFSHQICKIGDALCLVISFISFLSVTLFYFHVGISSVLFGLFPVSIIIIYTDNFKWKNYCTAVLTNSFQLVTYTTFTQVFLYLVNPILFTSENYQQIHL